MAEKENRKKTWAIETFQTVVCREKKLTPFLNVFDLIRKIEKTLLFDFQSNVIRGAAQLYSSLLIVEKYIEKLT